MRLLAVAAALSLVSPAFAQQQPDPAFLQRALASMQSQRNQAMDALAVSEAKSAGLADDLAKAQIRIKELDDKTKKK